MPIEILPNPDDRETPIVVHPEGYEMPVILKAFMQLLERVSEDFPELNALPAQSHDTTGRQSR